MSANVARIRKELKGLGEKERAEVSQRFFKTGPGEYGEGDVFVGVRVPDLRRMAKRHREIPIRDIKLLLKSKIHEERFLALLVLVLRYQNGNESVKKRIYRLYLNSTRHINNWDLVDVTSPAIVGHFLSDKDRTPLYDLAGSTSLWERRIAIISTLFFIRQKDFEDTLAIARRLLADPEDLIHKAVGWMLREVGKRDQKAEESFLRIHYRKMPRTMLRYAIERFPERPRQQFLKGRI
ncbi:MAG: DNA alkylation repair protein [Candidatus Latescibacterota bacterium]|nr:MAG: DNA alkylation repair protein [Candidatus Latescibacterota bacterium]